MAVANKELEKKIERLLTYMEQAVQESNWFKVKQADKKMQLLFKALQNTSFLGSLQAQNSVLQGRYRAIITAITKQQRAVKEKMQSHQKNKEGIAAYEEYSKGSDL